MMTPTSSPTATLLEDAALYGTRPSAGETDFRPLPESETITFAMSQLIEATTLMVANTSLEDDLSELLWSQVNIFHRRLTHMDKLLDDNEVAQKRAVKEQDGSEVKSVELEQLIAQGQVLLEKRDAFESMRDLAAEHFQVTTASPWLPRIGSKVSHKNLTAAVIDSRDFVSAKRRQETEVHCPKGTRIAITGGDFQDYQLIWDVLDKVHGKYPDMVLLHGGADKGVDFVAAKWAQNRKVAQVAFKPDWTRNGKAAPFKRNDELLKVMPQGLIVCPGNGIHENLADKARKLGIAVKRLGA